MSSLYSVYKCTTCTEIIQPTKPRLSCPTCAPKVHLCAACYVVQEYPAQHVDEDPAHEMLLFKHSGFLPIPPPPPPRSRPQAPIHVPVRHPVPPPPLSAPPAPSLNGPSTAMPRRRPTSASYSEVPPRKPPRPVTFETVNEPEEHVREQAYIPNTSGPSPLATPIPMPTPGHTPTPPPQTPLSPGASYTPGPPSGPPQFPPPPTSQIQSHVPPQAPYQPQNYTQTPPQGGSPYSSPPHEPIQAQPQTYHQAPNQIPPQGAQPIPPQTQSYTPIQPQSPQPHDPLQTPPQTYDQGTNQIPPQYPPQGPPQVPPQGPPQGPPASYGPPQPQPSGSGWTAFFNPDMSPTPIFYRTVEEIFYSFDTQRTGYHTPEVFSQYIDACGAPPSHNIWKASMTTNNSTDIADRELTDHFTAYSVDFTLRPRTPAQSSTSSTLNRLSRMMPTDLSGLMSSISVSGGKKPLLSLRGFTSLTVTGILLNPSAAWGQMSRVLREQNVAIWRENGELPRDIFPLAPYQPEVERVRILHEGARINAEREVDAVHARLKMEQRGRQNALDLLDDRVWVYR
ncbi:hypothetical protein BJX62DRAFT_235470 [Aspergillus germanicus]